MMWPLVLALNLVVLHNGGGHEVIINPKEVTLLREPREGEHMVNGTECAIFFTDGKLAAVVETCEQVRELIEKSGPR
jgi:hypothetical protein